MNPSLINQKADWGGGSIAPPSTPKYRIALFQGGLGDDINYSDDNYFKKTVSNIINYAKKDDSPLIIDNGYNSTTNFIDMAYFNVVNMQFKTTAQQSSFDSQISAIYEKAKEFSGKTLLVRTFLNRIYDSEINYDSIENQKTKLIYIIDSLKQYDNVEIFLVGHSQGGLVNLETVIERTEDISRIISLSTPYAPVDFARIYYPFLLINDLINYVKYLALLEDEYRVSHYRLCVEKLASSEYFTNLKNRWNAISSHPRLTIITGTAGRVCTIASAGEIFSYTPEMCEAEAFDLLVKLSEQKDISYANIINFIDTSVPCYNIWKNAALNCVTSTNCANTCSGACGLDTLSIAETVFDAVGEIIDEFLSSEKASEIDYNIFINNPLINTIFAGLFPNDSRFACREGYEDYYRVASSDYNHLHIMYNEETTALLFDLLT